MRGWVIRWSWIGSHAEVEEPIIGVLSARRRAREIQRLVETLYIMKDSTFSEQLEMARYNKPAQNPYPAHLNNNWEGTITCGHNPFIEAFLADDINVVVDENGNENISYIRRKNPQISGNS